MPFHDFVVSVEVRKDPSLGLTDNPSDRLQFPVNAILKQEYKYITSEKIRASHLSWSGFCEVIEERCKFPLDFQRCELGFIIQPPYADLSQQYFTITSELTFQNALTVLFNNWEPENQKLPMLPIHLWNPKPTEPVFRRSARARDLPLRSLSPMVQRTSMKSPHTSREGSHDETDDIPLPKPFVPVSSESPHQVPPPISSDVVREVPNPNNESVVILESESPSESESNHDSDPDFDPEKEDTEGDVIARSREGSVDIYTASPVNHKTPSRSKSPAAAATDYGSTVDFSSLAKQLAAMDSEIAEPDEDLYDNEEDYRAALADYEERRRRLELSRLVFIMLFRWKLLTNDNPSPGFRLDVTPRLVCTSPTRPGKRSVHFSGTTLRKTSQSIV